MNCAVLAGCSFFRFSLFFLPVVVVLGGCSTNYAAMEEGVKTARQDVRAVSDSEKEPITRMAFIDEGHRGADIEVLIGSSAEVSDIEPASGDVEAEAKVETRLD